MSGIIGTSPNMKSGVIGKTFGLQSMQVFSTAGAFTWTKPAGITTIKVIVTGGGGGGGAGDADDNQGASGGAGGSAMRIIDVRGIASVSTGNNVGSAGAGGAAGYSGTVGGDSQFGASGDAFKVVATGGGPGNMSGIDDDDKNEGGVGTSGDFLWHGGAGSCVGTGDLTTGTRAPAPNGGASYWGGGARSANARFNNSSRPAFCYGAGGGSGCEGSATMIVGQDGKCGVVVIEEYCN